MLRNNNPHPSPKWALKYFIAGFHFLCPPYLTLWFGLALLMLLLYTVSVPGNQLGFYIDESSVAYNAFTIAQSGADEHGAPWPLYFGAFGEFKNPTLIYLLAGCIRLFGPSILAPRLVCALAGWAAALLLGLLARRVAEDDRVGLATAFSVALTPWFFEVSRLVFEVALYPLLLALFLLALRWISDRGHWSWSESVLLSLLLALLTYSYSTGRLLAPLLALGLMFFIRRGAYRGILLTWGIYGLLLLPLLIFAWRHPGALSARLHQTSYITPERSWINIIAHFVYYYARNLNPHQWLAHGDPNTRHHVPGMGSLLFPTFALAVLGAVLLLRRDRRDPWGRFAIHGFAVSPIPASLAWGAQHTLRLIAIPVFMTLLAIPALQWLGEAEQGSRRRAALRWLILLTVVQGAVFQTLYYWRGPQRDFDFGFVACFDAATALPDKPIYIQPDKDQAWYIQAKWYGAVRGLETGKVLRLNPGAPPPAGAVVIGEGAGYKCESCRVIKRQGDFIVYLSQ